MNLYYKMRHLLLIDNSIKDLAVFQGCINTNTDSIVFDFASETLDSLQTKLSAFGRRRQFQHVGIVQENGPTNKFLKLVENQALVQWIVDKTKCIALDLFTCNIMKDPKWKKTIQMIQTTFPQIALGASDDVTGNNKSGGDWIAETGGTDLKAVYLTDAITQYRGTFGVNPPYSIILDGSGGCYVMGYNEYGTLGLGIGKAFTSISPAQRLSISGKNITDVQLGNRHSVFLCSDGSVYSCGYNSNGQLGLGNTDIYYSPTQITDISNISAIACGEYHTLFLHNNGSVYSCGYNNYGQLGVGEDDYDDRLSPQLILQSYFGGANVSAIACGNSYSMFLCTNGELYGTGDNESGQLGTDDSNSYNVPTQVYPNNFLSEVAVIACGNIHTLFLCYDGTVYGTGENGSGQLGINGDSNYYAPTLIDSISGVGMVFCGYSTSYFICSNGDVYGCGYNSYGQLGLGTNGTNEYTPTLLTFFSDKIVNYIQASDQFTIYVCNDTTVYGSGNNYNGETGDGTVERIIIPTSYTTLNTTFSKTIISTYYSRTFSIFVCNDGTVYGCGDNYSGNLGLGHNSDVSGLTQITTNIGSKIVSKVATCLYINSTTFLCSDGTVYSCGSNSYGQLGLGHNTDINIPTQITSLSNIVDIACGGNHVLFLDESGNVYSCGRNYHGVLGLNDLIDKNIPTQIPSSRFSNIPVISVSAGLYQSYFICSNHTGYSCGNNSSGELGLSYYDTNYPPVYINIPTLMNMTNISKIASYYQTCFVLDNSGNVFGCGKNNYGELGIGSYNYNANLLQNNPISSISNIIDVACGENHVLFLDISGNVYGTGNNLFTASLGLPLDANQIDAENYPGILTPTQITIGSNKVVSQIFAGSYRSSFLCNDNSFYVCGQNGYNYYYILFGLKYITNYNFPALATFNATIAANLVVPCFGEGTEILTVDGENETYVPVEKLVPGSIVKTYLHGPQVVKKISKGSLLNNSEDPKKCMFKMEKTENMTADLCLTGGHALLKTVPPKGLRFKIDDQYLHFVENLPEFKKMAPRKYNHYNFCFENGGNKDLRYGVWANGVLCETPSEKQLDSFQ